MQVLFAVLLFLIVPGGDTDAPGAAYRYHYYMPVFMQGELPRRGIGSPYASCANVEAMGAAWFHTWQAQPPDCQTATAFAMVWGYTDALPDVPPHVRCVQGPNEPDLCNGQQSCVSPSAGAELWRRMEAKYRGKCLIAPVPSPWGSDWLSRWRDAYISRYGVAPKADALAAHCYFQTAEQCIAHLRWYIDRLREWGARGVYLTEFAFLPCVRTDTGVGGCGSFESAQAEADRLIAWLEATPEILGYAWFADEFANEAWTFQPLPQCDTALMRGGTLTRWGQWYRSK